MSESTFQFPPLSLFKRSVADDLNQNSREDIDRDWQAISQILQSAEINANVTSSISGMQSTRFELQLGPGVPLEALDSLRHQFRSAFADRGPVMLLLPIPGRDRAGIEVPNRNRRPCTTGDLLATNAWANTYAQMPLMVGRDVLGATTICDLIQAQHLLLGGDDGATLSNLMRQFVCSLAMRFAPADLRMLCYDAQSRDMRPFGQLPHMIIPPISSVPGALTLLQTLHDEMRYRQQQCQQANVQSLEDYNALYPSSPFPRLVFFVNELSPMLKHARRDAALSHLQSLLAGARVGIHLILATRYPYAENLPAEITSAIPWRFASHANSAETSQLLIDSENACDLLGGGDCLFRSDRPIQRCQCGEITEAECRDFTKFWTQQVSPQHDQELQAQIAQADLDERNAQAAAKAAAEGPMLPFSDLMPRAAATANDALKAILARKQASPSGLMEDLGVTRERAINLLDELTAHDYLKRPADGSEEREINYAELPSEAVLNGQSGRKTITELYAELAKKVEEGDPTSRTVAEFNKGVHAIGKKIVEEAAETWMAAEYESVDNATLEISELIYHILVMMLKKGITMEDIYKKL